jgi:hypothetical protein
MAITKLKSELNRLQVCIVGNQAKTTLQAKLLTAYQEELLDKVAKFYRNYHDSHYRVLHISKSKSCVTFGCTRYQVTAPGVVSNPPWTDYKSCKKIINNHPTLDMKNNCQSCPGKMIVVITNGTVGLPSFPLPFHLCGNVSSIPITFRLDKSVPTTTLPSLVSRSTLLLRRNSTTLINYNLLSSITIHRPHRQLGHGDINKTI